MKKIIHLFCVSLFLLVSCTEDVALEVDPVSEPFFASVEGTTRTYADENGKLLWTANDRITIFKGTTYPLVYQFTGSTGDNYGGFNDVTTSLGEFNTSNSLPTNYAIYPYAEGTTISNSGVINYTIPATQTYAENSFGLGANVMVAVTENKDDRNLEFKNVGGYFEFSLYGEDITVDRIEFSGNNNEKLAGDATITATHDGSPSLAFADDATTTLTLDCGEGVELGENVNNPTKFWFVVPAITYEDGITITITDTEGNEMEKTTENRITIERSTVQPLAAFKVETYPPVPTNQIWYTSTDGNVVTPYKTDVFGANIISNVYENGKGIITFDGNVTSIGDDAFLGRESLENITIPDGVTSIGDSAFGYCRYLKRITIPNSVTSIGMYAFAGCSTLSSITIPDSVTSIGEGAFSNCASLSNITISNGVTSIGDYAFKQCVSLSNITIPDSVTSIENNSFCGCSSLESFEGKYASSDKRCLIVDGVLKSFAPAGLTSYTIPSSVTSIGHNAFWYCSTLLSITIPYSVTSIGSSAFSECYALTSITIPESVTSIGYNAFMSCYSLSDITIPNSVTSLGGYVFFSCGSLSSITIPDSVTSIGNGAFAGCSSLASFDGKYASADNRCLIVDDELISFAPAGLTSYTIPSGVTSIGSRVFYNFSSLVNVNIPIGVTSIGNYAFDGCESLYSITIPDSVTSIGESAFAGCVSLSSIVLSDSLTSIGMYAFAGCSTLSSITIPDSVTLIGKCVFLICDSLTTVYSKKATPPSAERDMFEYCDLLTKIYVPTSSVNAYKSASGWSNYASKIEGYDFSN